MTRPNGFTSLASGPAKILSLLGFVVVFPLTICMVLSLMGVPVKGFEWLHSSPPPPTVREKPTVTVVDYNATPAHGALMGTLRALDHQWSPTSSVVDSAGLPHPLYCVEPAPSISESRAYSASGVDTQVTLAAYPAGMGSAVFRNLVDRVDECKPSTTSVYSYPRSGVGVEVTTMEVSWAINHVQVTIFRRGDVVGFVATDSAQDSFALARTVDSALEKNLPSTVCPDQEGSLRDQYRNAFTAEGSFTGKTTKKILREPKAKPPALSPAQRRAGIERVAVPSPDKHVTLVDLPSSDYDYPLWPPLPAAQALPVSPTPPLPQKTRGVAEVRVPDPVGPGCGWAFLTVAPPSYDEGKVASANAGAVSAVQDELLRDRTRWQKEVRAYWTAYQNYLQQVAAYRVYKAQVAGVAAAWEAIHEAWRQYYTDYANWQAEMAARDQLIADQAAAQTEFDAQKAECKAYPSQEAQWKIDHAQWVKDHAQWEKDLQYFNDHYDELYAQYQEDLAAWRQADPATRGPKPQPPTAPVEPVEPQEPVLDHPCPPVKPEVLSEVVPPKTKAPKPPADPRPLSERN